MKKGDVIQGFVERVEFPNKGIVRTQDGERIIVKNTIPGQTVACMINKVRKGKYEGRLLETVQPSAWENNPACAYFGQCGGCVYQTMDYGKQLEMKSSMVKSLLDEVAVDNYDFEGILASPRFEQYRNKMEFSFGDASKGGVLELGQHKRNSMFDVITVDGCKIVDEDFSAILTCVCDFYREKGIPYYHKVKHTGILRHLLVRKAARTGEILVDLITVSKPDVAPSDTAGNQSDCTSNNISDHLSNKMLDNSLGSRETLHIRQVLALEELSQKLQALPLKGTLVGFLHTVNDSLADAVVNQGTEIIYGKDFFYEKLLGLQFKITPFSFFQTNSLGAEVLYSKAREYIGNTKDMTVFDLYSGTGTIAQVLAPVAKRVVGVEIVEEAVAAAIDNARQNGLFNCEFIAGDVLKVLDDINDKPDIIVLDPPRDGIHPKALEKIINYGVNRLVYISCKPTSLARDLVTLQERGYRLEKACCVDMFPGTGHVETVVLTSRKRGF